MVKQQQMDLPTLMVSQGRYPFGSKHPRASVQEQQEFSNQGQKREKKVEMLKKAELVTNPSVIAMTCVVEQPKALVYFYQFVPHSIPSYLQAKKDGQSQEIWSMTKNLLNKKLAYQLTMLISYLGKMRIEVELSLTTLGICDNEKLKLYISPRSKMGIKAEIHLIVTYNQAKDRIIKEVQQILQQLEAGMPLQTSSPPIQLDSGMHFPSPIPQQLPSYRNISRMQAPGCQLRKTRSFRESSEYRQRKMSSGHMDLGRAGEEANRFTDRVRQSSKAHKYSMQYGGNQSDHETSFPEAPQQRPCDSGIGMAKSKSIRIELEQNSNPNQKRKRKDSYKVKITTFREYEVEGNPSDLFGIDPNAKEDDVFDYFAKKAKREDRFSREDENQAEEGLHEDEEGYQEEEAGEFKLPEYDDKNRKQTGETNFSSVQNNDFVPPPLSMQDKRSSVPPANPNARLEERIREAKERTNKALNLIKTLRK